MPSPVVQDTRVGNFIRHHVLPPGMSVKEAAQRLDVGRPALSNLLNGKASLSPRMALRLERAFGADRKALLDLQASSDQDRRRDEDKAVGVRAYVPSFLTIKARQISDWAENNIEARQQLPVLLRTLIRSTGRDLRSVDFPGYDEAERRGWDGQVEAGEATAWIPEGVSGWEFGTGRDPKRKADHDYSARLASVASERARANRTFVFVTPRSWRGKADWVANKEAASGWRAVRAYDASDLEQWLEDSVAAQIWLARKISIPVEGIRTLDECWEWWAAASEPRMTADIFKPSIEAYRNRFTEWLGKPSDRPFVVSADSKDEALAFLACLFQDAEVATRSGDSAAIFESAQTLRALAVSTSPFIPIVCSDDVERELAAVYRERHCIVVRPRNAVDREPDIALDTLTHEAFRQSLSAMGFNRHRIEQLARESGRSPSILRRRLSVVDAIRMPRWAKDRVVAKALIPMALVGAWHAASNADKEILSTLAERPYKEIEQDITSLLRLDDCPVWSVGLYRGVISKIDVLFAINGSVTEKNLVDFLEFAEYVLSESDPAVELPEDQRWAAALHGKVRDHSDALRTGICETLVMLTVHGNDLFRDRLGVDAGGQVSGLVRKLLSPLTIEKLLSQNYDLPKYAEAAPDTFLTLFETDLATREPVTHGLLKPADSGVFGSCPRTGLLWALECLAWNPRNLPRVSALLARLTRTRIDDNWVNKPFRSLSAIFRSWMPQTAGSLDERVRTLEMICEKLPNIGWSLCVEQLAMGPRFGDLSYRPRWRSDASGAGEPVTNEEMHEFCRKALDIAFAWPTHDAATLGDLVEHLDAMCDTDQAILWKLIDAWSQDETTVDEDRAAVREGIRRAALTMRGRHRGLSVAARDKARTIYEKLAPRSPVTRHAWLFANQWVQESADGIKDDYLDMKKREKRIHKLRTDAITDIWQEAGLEGVADLLDRSNASEVVGRYTALCSIDQSTAIEILQSCLSGGVGPDSKVDGFMMGFIPYVGGRMSIESVDDVLLSVAAKVGSESAARLLRCAPFGNQTWRLLDGQPQEVREKYWRVVHAVGWSTFSEAEWGELVDRLVEADRPLAAFRVLAMQWEKIETSRLRRLLWAIVNKSTVAEEGVQIDTCEISSALNALDGRIGVTPEEMARLEFAFMGGLVRTSHGIPNLEREFARSPVIFVQILALNFRRNDDGEDPPDWYIEDAGRRSTAATAGYTLLEEIKRIPGTNDDGKICTASLGRWVAEARHLCVKYGRSDVGEECLGRILSRAPEEEDGAWPCIPICEVLETVHSEDMANGFLLGARSARGVSVRKLGDGGGQERDIASRYRRWAEQRSFEYPFVGAILNHIADAYDDEAKMWDSNAKLKPRLPL